MKKIAGNLKMKKVRTPSRLTIRYKRSKPKYVVCGNCGSKLNRTKLSSGEAKKLAKTKLRPERPFPHLCPYCMREEIKSLARGA